MARKLKTEIKALKLHRSNLRSDLIAGLTFAIVNVPQSMAHALLASVNPVFGIYTLMVALPVGAVFASSVYMNISTTGALAVAAGAGLAGIPVEQRVQALITIVFIAGLIQLLAGLNHLRFSPGSDVFDQLQHLDHSFVPNLGVRDQYIYPGSKPAPGFNPCLLNQSRVTPKIHHRGGS